MACQAVGAATGAEGSAEVSVVVPDSVASDAVGSSFEDDASGAGEGSLLFSLLSVDVEDIKE